MENKKMLLTGIELLQSLNVDDAEVVEIENSKYDDGSHTFSVSVAFPAIQEIEVDGVE